MDSSSYSQSINGRQTGIARCKKNRELLRGSNSYFRCAKNYLRKSGGGGGIRTPVTLSGQTVFKTAGFNRSPTPPFPIITNNNTYRGFW